MEYTGVNHNCDRCGKAVDMTANPKPVAAVVGTTLQYSHGSECPALWAKAMNEAARGKQVILGGRKAVA